MDNREWLDDYNALKQVNTNNPFTVPSGYFDEMEQRITSYIHLEEMKPENEGFTIPENYFDDLSANIQSRIAIEEMAGDGDGFAVPEDYFNELSNNIQSRIAIEEMAAAEDGFTVPENYFDELSANIQGRIAIEEMVGAEDGFAVPENYFEDLAGQVTARVQVEEAMQDEASFSVPEGYFENLNKKIQDKTVNVDKSKQDKEVRRGVIRKMFATTAFKYAAAACFAVVAGATILLNQASDPLAEHNSTFLHQQISTLPVNDIQTYLQDDVDANDVQHTVIDENAPVNDAKLDNALKSIDGNNQ